MPHVPPPRITPAGDQAFLIRFQNEISPAMHERVAASLAALDQSPPSWLVDCVPAYCSILVVYEPRATGPAVVLAWIEARLACAAAAAVSHRNVTVPVWYDPEVGWDLEDLARTLGISAERVVALHTAPEYLVYMLGFKPGFPYLGELPAQLRVSRLPTPRPAVPAGSVAVAGRQTGIYPVASPGGWRILGRTPWRIFDPAARVPFRILPGDRVRFEAIDQAAYRELGGRESTKGACRQP